MSQWKDRTFVDFVKAWTVVADFFLDPNFGGSSEDPLAKVRDPLWGLIYLQYSQSRHHTQTIEFSFQAAPCRNTVSERNQVLGLVLYRDQMVLTSVSSCDEITA